MTNNAPRILTDDFAPGFYIKHFIKDMEIAKDVANHTNLDLPVLNAVLKNV
ncbi:MAG: NAD-binding protein [Thomasclavelia ramosa]